MSGSYVVRVRFVSGSCLGSWSRSRLVSCLVRSVRVWLVFGSCLVRVRFVSGFMSGTCLVPVRLVFVSGFVCLVRGWLVSGSCLDFIFWVRVWFAIGFVLGFVFGFVSGSCLVRIRFVFALDSGFIFDSRRGSQPESCLVSVWVRVWYVSVSYLVLVWVRVRIAVWVRHAYLVVSCLFHNWINY